MIEAGRCSTIRKAGDIYNTFNMWRSEAGKGVDKDPAVQKSGAAWKQCLRNAGYHVDISAPYGDGDAMPTQKLGEEIGMFTPQPTRPPRTDGRT